MLKNERWVRPSFAGLSVPDELITCLRGAIAPARTLFAVSLHSLSAKHGKILHSSGASAFAFVSALIARR